MIDIQQIKERLIDKVHAQPFEDRVYNFNDPMIQEIYTESEEMIKLKIEMESKKMEEIYGKGTIK